MAEPAGPRTVAGGGGEGGGGEGGGAAALNKARRPTVQSDQSPVAVAVPALSPERRDVERRVHMSVLSTPTGEEGRKARRQEVSRERGPVMTLDCPVTDGGGGSGGERRRSASASAEAAADADSAQGFVSRFPPHLLGHAPTPPTGHVTFERKPAAAEAGGKRAPGSWCAASSRDPGALSRDDKGRAGASASEERAVEMLRPRADHVTKGDVSRSRSSEKERDGKGADADGARPGRWRIINRLRPKAFGFIKAVQLYRAQLSPQQLEMAAKFAEELPMKALVRICSAMASADGVEVKDRRWLDCTHSACFIASEAVSWMYKNVPCVQTGVAATEPASHAAAAETAAARPGESDSPKVARSSNAALARVRAVMVGMRLQNLGFITHVNDDEQFADQYLLFQFVRREELQKEEEADLRARRSSSRLPPPDMHSCLIALLSKRDCGLLQAIYLSAGAQKGPLVSALLSVLMGTKQVLPVAQECAQQHVQTCKQESTLFRTNSLCTELMSRYAKEIGADYLEKVIAGSLKSFLSKSFATNVDVDDEGQALENSKRLVVLCETLFESIVNTVQWIPLGIRLMCNVMHTEVGKKFESSALMAVGGFFFLRFVCPYIVKISQQDPALTSQSASEHMKRLVQVSMVMQGLSNGRPVSNATFAYVNEHFVAPNIERVTKLFATLAAIPVGDTERIREWEEAFERAHPLRCALDTVGMPHPTHKDISRWTPVHMAASNGDLKELYVLLEAPGVDVRAPNADMNTVLHYLPRGCSSDNIKAWECVFLRIVAMGADVNARNRFGETPLFRASVRKKLPAASILLANGADPDLATTDFMTPLHIAAQRGNQGLVELLLACGANPDPLPYTNGNSGESIRPVHMARKFPSIVQVLERAIAAKKAPGDKGAEGLARSGSKAMLVRGRDAERLSMKVDAWPALVRDELLEPAVELAQERVAMEGSSFFQMLKLSTRERYLTAAWLQSFPSAVSLYYHHVVGHVDAILTEVEVLVRSLPGAGGSGGEGAQGGGADGAGAEGSAGHAADAQPLASSYPLAHATEVFFKLLEPPAGSDAAGPTPFGRSSA